MQPDALKGAIVMRERSMKRSARCFFTLVFAGALALLDATSGQAAAPPGNTKLGKR